MDSSLVTSINTCMRRYGWQLIEQDEFVRLVEIEMNREIKANSVHAAILCVYSRALYWSCSGAEGQSRQEQAYRELTVFLDQIAARRYSAVRGDTTQGALERIYRSFASCRQPETFLAFALQKLRDAARYELRLLQRAETNISLDAEVERGGAQIASADSDMVDVVLQNDMRQRFAVFAKHFVQEHPRAAHQLAVLWLKYINGYDDLTIAKQLDKTVLAVQVQRSRALVRLRQDADLCAFASELGLAVPHMSAG